MKKVKPNTLHRAISVISINMMLIVLGILTLEAGYRAIRYVSSCAKHECDANYIRFSPPAANQNIGLTVFHPVLGFVPRPHFDEVIKQPSWNNARVTITEDGYRSNDNLVKRRDFTSLAIGDSFTFGNQVSNLETWVSCLSRDGGLNIANAGVPGYGAAQSVMRGQIELAHKHIDLVIWSILVDEDFSRDRLIVHSGFIKPAVISTDGTIKNSAPPDNSNAKSRQYYEPDRHAWLRSLLNQANRLLLVQELSTALGLNERVDIPHPKAASLEQTVNFAFDEFSRLPAKRKLVVLQYFKRNASEKDSPEHDLLTSAAEVRKLPLLDTKVLFNGKNPKEIWDGHHTPLGNRLVCEGIIGKLQNP